MDLLQQKDVAGGVFLGEVDQKMLRVLGRLLRESPFAVFFVVGCVDDNEDIDGDDIVESGADVFPFGFGTYEDDNDKIGKFSRFCNMVCSSP
mmetsp:Transcript_27379/g.64135  ORF Transcript_27379/g.64135 Transcript_27379/m.64135 type:complete len:92 (-) Transcript_27379:660-935(-)